MQRPLSIRPMRLGNHRRCWQRGLVLIAGFWAGCLLFGGEFSSQLTAAETRPMSASAATTAALPGKPNPAPARVVDQRPQGTLFIVGGALRFNNRDVWVRMIERAPRPAGKLVAFEKPQTKPEPQSAPRPESKPEQPGLSEKVPPKPAATASTSEIASAGGIPLRPRFAVFPTASSNPLASGARIVDTLNRHGADAFVVPVTQANANQPLEQAAQEAALVEQVRSCGGVFFTGGEQRRIVEALYTKEGKNTPMLDAVWDVYRRGGVIAGTSAGAAVMSHIMCREARNVLATLQHGVKTGKEVDRGLGFLDADWFVDQHALVRGRFARALVIMRSQGLKYGLGVDENTAIEVRYGQQAEVVGDRGALVLDLSQAVMDDKIVGFNLKNAKLSYLEDGDAIDLKSLRITAAPEKRSGRQFPALPPERAATSNPDGNIPPLFTNDILGNTTVADVLTKLIASNRREAIGLAFDGHKAREAPSPGFEFRFYRDAESNGWATSDFGGEAYTVTNIRLDVRPIQITGPLYK